jgi:hypothetical protein
MLKSIKIKVIKIFLVIRKEINGIRDTAVKDAVEAVLKINAVTIQITINDKPR